MKRAICLFFISVFVFLSKPVITFAADVNLELDSLVLSNEEKESLGILKVFSDENTKPEYRINDNIVNTIRIYNVSLLSAFTEYSTIDEIIRNNCVKETFFVMENKDGSLSYFDNNYEKLKSNRYAVIDDKEVELPPIEVSPQAFATIKSLDFLKNNVSADIQMDNVYYLSDEANMMGTVIYYKTNHGDYVYYYHYDTGELLFTIDEFVQFEKSIMEEISKDGYSDGAASLKNMGDFSRFELTKSVEKSSGNSNETSGRIYINDTLKYCGGFFTALLLFILALTIFKNKRKCK